MPKASQSNPAAGASIRSSSRPTKRPSRFRNSPAPAQRIKRTDKGAAADVKLEPLTASQRSAVVGLLVPLQEEVTKLRAHLNGMNRELQRYKSAAPGIDVELTREALTAAEVAARDRLYKTANHLLSMETAREMHAHVMTLSGQDAAYFDAYRRQYFLQCFAQQRDYHRQLTDLCDTEFNR